MEAGVANLVVIEEHLATRLADGLLDMGTGGLGDALITLAVVVGADIEDGMVFAVVPADELIVLSREREETVGAFLMLFALGHLSQEP